MDKQLFLARGVTDSREERGTLVFNGVLPRKGESFGSIEEAVKALEATSDPRAGWLIIEVITPQKIEVKVTVPPDIQRFDATKKA